MSPMVIHETTARFTSSELDELRRLAEDHGIDLPAEPRTLEEAFAAILCALGPAQIRRFCEIAGINPDDVLPEPAGPTSPSGS